MKRNRHQSNTKLSTWGAATIRLWSRICFRVKRRTMDRTPSSTNCIKRLGKSGWKTSTRVQEGARALTARKIILWSRWLVRGLLGQSHRCRSNQMFATRLASKTLSVLVRSLASRGAKIRTLVLWPTIARSSSNGSRSIGTLIGGTPLQASPLVPPSIKISLICAIRWNLKKDLIVATVELVTIARSGISLLKCLAPTSRILQIPCRIIWCSRCSCSVVRSRRQPRFPIYSNVILPSSARKYS